MKHLLSRLSYANVISTLCLVLVLGGGTAYAATQLAKNSVGTNQLKNGAVTPAKLSGAAKQTMTGPTGPTGPKGATGARGATGAAGGKGEKGDRGEKGEKGVTGDSATKLFAEIGENGELLKASGVTAAAFKGTDGAYSVTFNTNVSACVAMVTGVGQEPGVYGTVVRTSAPDTLEVFMHTSKTEFEDAGFTIAVFC
jgi:hypothetical protein